MAELSDKQKRCDHRFVFLSEDLATGKRIYECWKCGVWMDGRAQAGTMSWKAQKMLEVTGRGSVTLGEAVEWFDENYPHSPYVSNEKRHG